MTFESWRKFSLNGDGGRNAVCRCALQVGAAVANAREVNASSWRASFPHKGESLLERFHIPPPTCKDATDAVCILLHQLVVKNGFPLTAAAYEAM